MDDNKFDFSHFDLKGDQHHIAFAFLIGMLRTNFKLGKETFTKEEIKKLVEEAVEYAKSESDGYLYEGE